MYTAGGRSSRYVRYSYEQAEVTSVPGAASYRCDSEYSLFYNRFTRRSDTSLSVSSYVARRSDGERDIEVFDYQLVSASQPPRDLSTEPGIMFGYGQKSTDITFDVDLPAVSASRYSVTMDLDNHYDDTGTAPVDQWTSGSCSVTASDGSELAATLVDADGDATYESLATTVGDDDIVRPLSEGYVVKW